MCEIKTNKVFRLELKLMMATVKAKTVNREVQLQALVDGKKIINIESIVRRDLQLKDAEGVDCLPNATIFEQLTLMSSKTTAWNEFSSTIASVIICLATNQKFNFSKYIFKSMVKNLDNVSGNFLMYPRFVQVFVNQQLEGMPTHKRIYIAPSHTKKIFGNMRRVGKGFSGRETPLFQTMMVQDQEEVGEGSEMPTDPHHTPTIIQPSTSQPQMKQRSRRPKRKDTQVPQSSVPSDNVADEAVNEEMDDSLVRAATTATSLDAEKDRGAKKPWGIQLLRLGLRMYLNFLMIHCLQENTKTAQAQEITSLKLRVKKLEKKGGSRTHKLKRLYKVGRSTRVISYDKASLGDQEDASKQGRKIDDIDKDVEITLVNKTQGRYGDDLMFDTVITAGEVVTTASVDISTASPTKTTIADDLTIAQTLIEIRSWDDVQAKIDADYQLAQRLQAQEQEELTDEEKARLFVQFLEQRRKHFAAKRAEEKRNRPPTRAQQRNIMCIYLKNIEGWKAKILKNKSFANIQELFDKEMNRVNTFIDYRTELVGSRVQNKVKRCSTREQFKESRRRAGTRKL
ncbi:hypothetical protein Tco_0998239 [Tanacetum coccineum]